MAIIAGDAKVELDAAQRITCRARRFGPLPSHSPPREDARWCARRRKHARLPHAGLSTISVRPGLSAAVTSTKPGAMPDAKLPSSRVLVSTTCPPDDTRMRILGSGGGISPTPKRLHHERARDSSAGCGGREEFGLFLSCRQCDYSVNVVSEGRDITYFRERRYQLTRTGARHHVLLARLHLG